MINYILLSIIILFSLSSCSNDTKTGFWSNSKKTKQVNNEKILTEKKKIFINKEFNTNIKIKLNENFDKLGFRSNNSNNYTIQNYSGNFKNSEKFKFKKIKSKNFLKSHLIFTKFNEVIYFDGEGSIFKLDNNLNLIWKKNYYTKKEKKLSPLLYFGYNEEKLIVTDNLSYLYSINLKDGELIWKKKNDASFNSQIKVLSDKFYAVDLNNILRCYSLENGKQIWIYKSENTFIKSKKVLSLIIEDEKVVFINTLGDINSIDSNTGELIWQTPTQNNFILEDSFSNLYSDLVVSGNKIFISNNNNEMFSLNLSNGLVDWVQKINSIITPSIVDKIIFTISNDGYLFLINKESGKIIRSTSIKREIKKFNDKNLPIVGFVIAKDKIFISLNSGKIIKINILNGIVDEIIKISGDSISKPFILNKKIYFITENSLILYD